MTKRFTCDSVLSWRLLSTGLYRSQIRCDLAFVAIILCTLGPCPGKMFGQTVASKQTTSNQVSWKKHIVVEAGHCNTAVALDVNRDGIQDVIASYGDEITLLVGPDWKRTKVLYRFPKKQPCIHSAVIDADHDGDLDWVGTLSNEHPFWLENPGDHWLDHDWKSRVIDPTLTGIHCILREDIDNDGVEDLVINNFEPEKGIGDSMAWYKAPGAKREGHWPRFIFADRDARGGSHYMGAGDIDGDGYKEIAVGAKGTPFADGNWFAFWKHPGAHDVDKPWQKTMLAENQLGATNILPADVNGDGLTDWIATRGHGVGAIWFENPSWKIHVIDDTIRSPHSLTVWDHDQDGDLDAAACGFESERLMWYENDGQGHFQLHTLDHSQQSYDLRSVDMDGDGDMDLLNAGRASGNVAWYENPLR
ncbi:MAG: FG-GAP repeat domain-containing protein [Aureliella sp.]